MEEHKITEQEIIHDLDHIIAERPMSPLQIAIVFMCFIMNMNDGIDVVVVSYTASKIQGEFLISDTLLGYIFSAGLAGMTLGCLLLAPLADKIGRRKLFLLAMGVETAAMFLSVKVSGYSEELGKIGYYQLLALRFFAGLGIGGLLPTMAAMAGEFSNNRRKDLSVGFVQAGWPIGAISMGFFTAWAVPQFGWRFAYFVGALISAAMLIMIIFFMPESIEYLWKKRPKNSLPKINKVLVKLGHEPIDDFPELQQIEKTTVKTLFNKEYRASTIRIWIGVFFGFMTLFTLISWVPKIAEEYSGMPYEKAAYAGTVYNIGAFLGSTGIGWLAARFRLKKLILTFFIIAFICMMIYGTYYRMVTLSFFVIFLIGFFVGGGFNGYWPLTARVYATEVRTTGIGMALGAGRLGAIAGPAAFGILSDKNYSIGTLFFIFSIPLIISGLVIRKVSSKNLR